MNRYEQLGRLIVDVIQETMDADKQVESSKSRSIGEDAGTEVLSEVIEIDSAQQIPWLVEAQKWEGKSEVFDQAELTAFLGVNPNDQDGGQAWCADFINAVMRECGIEGTGSSAAVSFEGWGTECECIDGAIAVYGPGTIPGGHVGIVLGDGLFGGNQGDSARLNLNRKWFDDNKTLIGYRCPPGYKLV